jgi:hypothetical protein
MEFLVLNAKRGAACDIGGIMQHHDIETRIAGPRS